jgi:hypothetical protein
MPDYYSGYVPPKLALHHNGFGLLRTLVLSSYRGIQLPLYDNYDSYRFPKYLKAYVHRLHFDPLFILSFIELEHYLQKHWDVFSDIEDERKLLFMYSIFILSVTGEIAAWDIEDMKGIDDSSFLIKSFAKYEEFNKLTNLIYESIASEKPTEGDISLSTAWSERLNEKTIEFGEDPRLYFKKKYRRSVNRGFLPLLNSYLKQTFLTVNVLCYNCCGFHMARECDSMKFAITGVLLDRWFKMNYDLDVDPRLKVMLKYPLFSVYHELACIKGVNSLVACHSIEEL